MRLRNLILGSLLIVTFATPVFGQDAPPLPTAPPSAPPIGADLPGFSDHPAIKLSPVRYEVEVAPGETKRGVVDVFNVSTRPVTVQPEAENARMVGDNGQLEFFLGDNPFKLNSFVKVDPTPFVLQPGEARRVSFAISVSVGVFPGGYYGALFMRLVASQPSGEGVALGVGGRTGTLLLLTVPGELQRQGQVDSLTVSGGLLASRHTLAASYRNTGNTDAKPLGVAMRPTGQLRLKNSFGRTVHQSNVDGEIVFPGSARQQRFGISKPLWFGRYTVELGLAAAPNGTPSLKSVSFWAFSPAALAVLLLATLLGTYGVRRVRVRRHRPAHRPPTARSQSRSLLEDADRSPRLDRPADES